MHYATRHAGAIALMLGLVALGCNQRQAGDGKKETPAPQVEAKKPEPKPAPKTAKADVVLHVDDLV